METADRLKEVKKLIKALPPKEDRTPDQARELKRLKKEFLELKGAASDPKQSTVELSTWVEEAGGAGRVQNQDTSSAQHADKKASLVSNPSMSRQGDHDSRAWIASGESDGGLRLTVASIVTLGLWICIMVLMFPWSLIVHLLPNSPKLQTHDAIFDMKTGSPDKLALFLEVCPFAGALVNAMLIVWIVFECVDIGSFSHYFTQTHGVHKDELITFGVLLVYFLVTFVAFCGVTTWCLYSMYGPKLPLDKELLQLAKETHRQSMIVEVRKKMRETDMLCKGWTAGQANEVMEECDSLWTNDDSGTDELRKRLVYFLNKQGKERRFGKQNLLERIRLIQDFYHLDRTALEMLADIKEQLDKLNDSASSKRTKVAARSHLAWQWTRLEDMFTVQSTPGTLPRKKSLFEGGSQGDKRDPPAFVFMPLRSDASLQGASDSGNPTQVAVELFDVEKDPEEVTEEDLETIEERLRGCAVEQLKDLVMSLRGNISKLIDDYSSPERRILLCNKLKMRVPANWHVWEDPHDLGTLSMELRERSAGTGYYTDEKLRDRLKKYVSEDDQKEYLLHLLTDFWPKNVRRACQEALDFLAMHKKRDDARAAHTERRDAVDYNHAPFRAHQFDRWVLGFFSLFIAHKEQDIEGMAFQIIFYVAGVLVAFPFAFTVLWYITDSHEVACDEAFDVSEDFVLPNYVGPGGHVCKIVRVTDHPSRFLASFFASLGGAYTVTSIIINAVMQGSKALKRGRAMVTTPALPLSVSWRASNKAINTARG